MLSLLTNYTQKMDSLSCDRESHSSIKRQKCNVIFVDGSKHFASVTDKLGLFLEAIPAQMC